MDSVEAAGLILTLTAVFALFIFMSLNTFPAFINATENWNKIEVSDRIGPETANFMWNYRALDLIAQALVLFGASVGCLALFREENGEEKRND